MMYKRIPADLVGRSRLGLSGFLGAMLLTLAAGCAGSGNLQKLTSIDHIRLLISKRYKDTD